jgi:hypothetical protein
MNAMSYKPNPWKPMSDPVDIRHLGKLQEELAECISASARCQIQGIDEAHPVTGKVNRDWLEDEIADVMVNTYLVIERFGLDMDKISKRAEDKKETLGTYIPDSLGGQV